MPTDLADYVLDMDNNRAIWLRDIVTKTHKIKIQSHMHIKLDRELTHTHTLALVLHQCLRS